MKVSNQNFLPAIQIEVQKKAEKLVEKVFENLFGKNFENTKALQEAAKITGKGNNLDLKV